MRFGRRSADVERGLADRSSTAVKSGGPLVCVRSDCRTDVPLLALIHVEAALQPSCFPVGGRSGAVSAIMREIDGAGEIE
jgi:hypothetical protein